MQTFVMKTNGHANVALSPCIKYRICFLSPFTYLKARSQQCFQCKVSFPSENTHRHTHKQHISTWFRQSSWKGCFGWNLGIYCSWATWESQRCQDSDGLQFAFPLLLAHLWMGIRQLTQRIILKIKRRNGVISSQSCFVTLDQPSSLFEPLYLHL